MARQSIISFAQYLGQGVILLGHRLGQGALSLTHQLWQLVPSWTENGASPHPRLAEITKREELKISDNEGVPSVYKLPMKETLSFPEKMITKQSFGERGEFEEKVLLLVGASGAGKSTLINAMVNYIMGVKWEDEFLFKVAIEEHQKNHINAYTFYPMDGSAFPYKLTIIDTPGFGGTEGLKRDREIAKQIKEFFSVPAPNGIDHLDGIGFVIQSSLARLTPTQECTFESILSIFGKDLSESIFMMLTFADDLPPPVLQALKDMEITISDRFLKFNNSALFSNDKESEEIFNAAFWKMSFQSFEKFFVDFADATSVRLDQTKEAWKQRDHLQTLLQGMSQEVDKGLDKIEEIRRAEEVHINEVQECLQRLDEFTIKRDPLLNVERVELLIDSEKKMAKHGWEQRVQYLNDAKHHAEMLSKRKRRLADIAKREELKIKDNKDGTPSIYKLPMKEKLSFPDKMITLQTLGEPGEFEEKVLLLVGATGAGKSTLTNAMVNYIMGVKWEDEFRFKVAIEEHQKNHINAYTFYPMDGSAFPYKLTIIDTPGFGGTEGLKRDREIAKQIEEFFSVPAPNGIDHLDGIGFVIQSSLAHLTPTQKCTFESILSIFGKDLSESIFMMLTFADDQTPPVLQTLKDMEIIISDRFFKFNNSALFSNNKESDEIFNAAFWKMSFQSFEKFFVNFGNAKSVHLDQTKEVFKRRDRLQTLLQGMSQQVDKGLDKIEEIRRAEEVHISKVQECLQRLEEIALKRDPFLKVGNVELLIVSEKKTAKRGWEQRIQFLKDAKHHAEMLSKTKRPLADIVKREELKIKDNKDGTPSIYKLPMEYELTNPERMIAKQSIGKPGKFQEKILLVVGATGAGKSTLINAMVNYIMGVNWEDDFRFKLAIDVPDVSTSKSQTKYITAYTFYPMDGSALPYKFTIIDTPGFGDTEGLKRDKFITQQIKEFFSIPPPTGIEHLDGIGFVSQASLARLTPTQEYIFASMLSIFGKDLSKNIFMMVTFADGQAPPVLQALKDAKITNSGKHFKFNNSALFADNKENEESFDAMFWKMGVRSIAGFFIDFEKVESVRLDLTKEVLEERDRLQTLLEGLNPQITLGLNKIEEMRQEEVVLQQREKEIETNKEFTYEVEVPKVRKVDISGQGRHTTTCLKCNFTCHNDCSYADDDDKYQCTAMNKSTGHCKVCPDHCYWKEHKNLPYLIEHETVVEIRTSEDLKRKYENAEKGKSTVEGMIEKLDEFLLNVHTKVLTMIHKAQECLRRLDEIALKPDPLSNVEYLKLLIESEKQQAKPGWSQRIQYYEEAKRHAEILSKVKDVKTAQKKIKQATRSGSKWYSRFKFW